MSWEFRIWADGLLGIYILVTSMVISGRVLPSDNAHSWWLHSAALMGDQAASTMTRYPTQSYHPDLCANQSFCYPNNAQHHARLATSVTFISHWFDSAGFELLTSTDLAVASGENFEESISTTSNAIIGYTFLNFDGRLRKWLWFCDIMNGNGRLHTDRARGLLMLPVHWFIISR